LLSSGAYYAFGKGFVALIISLLEDPHPGLSARKGVKPMSNTLAA